MTTIRKRLQDLHYSLNSSRTHLDQFIAEAAGSIPAGSAVLDAGAGDTRYAPHFSEHVYESADFGKVDKPYGGELTYTCDLRSIPVADGRYDLVLMTQVLEHLPEPAAVLEELARVLKPGGQLWLSTPLFYPEHEQPFDFFRYTQFGLTHLVTSAGFTVERISWLEGYLGTLSFQLETAARELPWSPRAYGAGLGASALGVVMQPLRAVFLAISLLLSRADVRHRVTTTGHCKNYCVVAAKPAAGHA